MYQMQRPILLLIIAALVCVGACTSPDVDDNSDSLRWRLSREIDQTINLGALFNDLESDSLDGVMQWQTSSASLDRAYEVKIHDIPWVVAVRGGPERIVFVSTTDARFLTTERIHVGSRMSEALKVSDGDVVLEPGFASWVSLPSGWCAASYANLTEDSIESSAVVNFLFKRN